MASIAFIVLTYNEEKHIERCLASLNPFASELFVVDSFSTDRTCEMAEAMGATVARHAFKNQAQQFNWALGALDIKAQWIWRVDADEYISPTLGKDVSLALDQCAADVNGVYVNKKIIFMGTPLMHGGWYPAPQIKVIRRGFGASENKMMDEHLIIHSGKVIRVDGDQTDENLNDIAWWSHKHVNYAMREAVNMLMMAYGMDTHEEGVAPRLFGTGAERKRWLKLRYAHSPLFVRPFLNFFVRYVLKGGFLDGKGGFVWYVLQGFWYRMLVDARIYAIKRQCHYDEAKVKQYIEDYLKSQA